MTRIRNGDAELYYEVLGNGPPVVLLHPFPANHELWLPVAQELTTRYRVVLPDLRAHGDSDAGEGPATMEKHAGDLARVCDDCGITKAVFGGESIGGYTLLQFWRRYRERVQALILCNTRAQADTEEGRVNRIKAAAEVLETGAEPFIEGMIPKLMGQTTRANRPDLVDAARRMMKKMSLDDISKVQRGMAERPDSVATLPSINVPTLIIAGEEDEATPTVDAELMHQKISRSRLRVIPRAGHYAVFEQSQAVAALIGQFLDSLPRW